MKRIEVRVEVEQMATGEDDTPLTEMPPEETSSMTLSEFIEDDQPSADTVAKLAAELARRFKYINARKTN